MATLLLVALTVAAVVVTQSQAAPRVLAAYLERRAGGHGAAIEAVAASVADALRFADRGDMMPRLNRPSFAGARTAAASELAPSGQGRSIVVTTSADLVAAVAEALPGDVITVAPGTYRFEGRAIEAVRAGRAKAPITVRAPALGTVRLEFAMLEGFVVAAPHWHFENLEIRGTCTRHDDCEHAFHVVGGALGTVIRNNDVRDFNAHVKINCHAGRFPDGGRIEGNTLSDSSARETDKPVTPIDLVAASGWRIEGNLIYDFVKAGGDATSYGAYAKGGGSDNAFVRNVVLCEHRLRGARGRRVGLSFGGGGSDPHACRDRRCVVEHDNGLMRDNLIASCSDDGIYLNRAARSQVLNNLLVDTAGLEVRFYESNGVARGNLIDGPIRVRDGGSLQSDDNLLGSLLMSYVGLHPVRGLFVDSGRLNFRWSGDPPRVGQSSVEGRDLCDNARPAEPAYGAFEDFGPCLRRGTR